MGHAAKLTLLFSLLSNAASQQIGTKIPEVHPLLPTYKCTKIHGCRVQNTSIVIDPDWRLASQVNGTGICKPPGAAPLNETLCPDAVTCARNCELQGFDYANYGVHTDNAGSLTLSQYVSGMAVMPRVYLLDTDGRNYVDLKLVNAEFSFDVDVSNLPCGMNGALYLSEMSMTGGRSDLNPAGATMGTGYCDAQCRTAFTWINGVANLNYTKGSCCNEMDIWESNSAAAKYVPHPCTVQGLYACTGDECAVGGVCTHTGCNYNAYNQGHPEFYAKNGTLDTSRPFTVVTQFLSAADSSSSCGGGKGGELAEIRRLYVQDGKTIPQPPSTSGKGDSLTDAFCGTGNEFADHGGMKTMGDALARGMVLVFAIWNDNATFMNSLDSGVYGPCDPSAGDPKNILAESPGTSVTFSNIKWGEIGTTY